MIERTTYQEFDLGAPYISFTSRPNTYILQKFCCVSNIRTILVFGQLFGQFVQYRGRKVRIVTKGISQLF